MVKRHRSGQEAPKCRKRAGQQFPQLDCCQRVHPQVHERLVRQKILIFGKLQHLQDYVLHSTYDMKTGFRKDLPCQRAISCT